VTIRTAVQAMLVGMPTPQDLHRTEVDGQVFITVGATVLFTYASDDAGLRNLAAVTLPQMGFTGRRVAQVLGITEVYVSMLRARARLEGSAAVTRRRGRPSALAAAQVRQARSWRAAGHCDIEIGARLGVHATTVARALVGIERPGPAPVQEVLPEPDDTAPEAAPTMAVPAHPEPVAGEPVAGEAEALTPDPEPAGSARVATGALRCRYAGAMLLHPYLDRVGAEAIFATLTGGPARRYNDLAVLSTATLGFAWGIDTVEGAKHLRRAEAGAALGLAVIPELATLRSRLSALADGSDPLAGAAGLRRRDAGRRPGRGPGLLRR